MLFYLVPIRLCLKKVPKNEMRMKMKMKEMKSVLAPYCRYLPLLFELARVGPKPNGQTGHVSRTHGRRLADRGADYLRQ